MLELAGSESTHIVHAPVSTRECEDRLAASEDTSGSARGAVSNGRPYLTAGPCRQAINGGISMRLAQPWRFRGDDS